MNGEIKTTLRNGVRHHKSFVVDKSPLCVNSAGCFFVTVVLVSIGICVFVFISSVLPGIVASITFRSVFEFCFIGFFVVPAAIAGIAFVMTNDGDL